MDSMHSYIFDNGKYKVIRNETGFGHKCLRYDEEWRDLDVD